MMSGYAHTQGQEHFKKRVLTWLDEEIAKWEELRMIEDESAFRNVRGHVAKMAAEPPPDMTPPRWGG